MSRLLPYIRIARPDHWLKNVFMVLGIVLAVFYRPAAANPGLLITLCVGMLSVCLVASSNYVINEVIDGPRDALHPVKRHRPVPAGLVNVSWAYVEWIALGAAGLLLAAASTSRSSGRRCGCWRWACSTTCRRSGSRTWPYLDVLSESVNNAIRLYLGWFAVIDDRCRRSRS